jgi:methylmalonyl-CoA mutase N-terminal domain/subunit
MTDRLERQAYEYFAKIDELGGMVEAVKRGFPQREIADAAFRYQQEVESGQRRVVGVNAYTEGDEEGVPLHRVDPELEHRQVERVRAFRARRPPEAVERALEELATAAADERENLMPHLIACARAEATEGEMVEALQRVFGTYREMPVF